MPTTRLHSFKINYHNQREFHQLKREIFAHHEYYFETENDNPAPLIFDVGANIGLATIYFKELYPQARIIAFEPLPQNVELLEENVAQNNLSDVEILPVALGAKTDKQLIYYDEENEWLSTASLREKGWTGQENVISQEVEVARLSSFMIEPIDLLKIDVEGYEEQILFECEDKLSLVKTLIFEWHPHPQQSWLRLRKMLEKQGFTIKLFSQGDEIDQPAKYNLKEPGKLLTIRCSR